MKYRQPKWIIFLSVAVAVLASGTVAMADTFGVGANQFNIDFVGISGATNPTSGYGIVNGDYRIGTYEISNAQWNKFKAAYGKVTGNPSSAYDGFLYYRDDSVAANETSWYEAAQFVNWLNTSTGHQAAYKFTGTQGTGNYTFVDWSPTDSGYNAADPYRNQNALYFLPSENEWVKAAYWNGTALQTYATIGNVTTLPPQGNGTDGTGWNYYNYTHYATSPSGPWAVGSGSEELNGTYDMMGDVREWMETPLFDPSFGAGSPRGVRGGDWDHYPNFLASSYRDIYDPTNEYEFIGFRVASAVPEPGSITLLIAGTIAVLIGWRRWW